MLDTTYLPAEAKFLVAVSGGADSMALLWLLHQSHFAIVAGHVNHGLRGQESDDDENFVLQTCENQGIAAVSQRVTLQEKSENEARLARYESLKMMAKEHNCSVIVTGHTADDVLETILLNWLRGATISGLAGIPPCRCADENLHLVRPILHLTRSQTRAICENGGWQWREDSSNASDVYTRNRIRHLLPLIAETGHVSLDSLAGQSARAAQIWREDNDFLDDLAETQLELLTLRQEPDLLVLNGLRFAQLSPTIGRRVLRCAVQKLNPAAREIGSEPIETARRHIANAGRHAVWQWPHQISIEWTGSLAGNRIRLRVVRGVAAKQ